MPVIESSYKAPLLFRNYHLSTIYASMFRKVNAPEQKRERLELPDGDFLDLDRSYAADGKSEKILIILHGLEGNAKRPYVMGMARHFNINGWDVAAVNFRGCSGEMNRLYRSYNAGATEDLEEVISHVLKENKHHKLALTGFSLGGNLMLKYLGERTEFPHELKAAVAISTPCDLYKSLLELDKPQNRIYSKRFVKKLKQQLYLRENRYPGKISKSEIDSCNSLLSIDDLYTGKAHGFKDALDYYEKNSSLQFIPNIRIPTLLLNAKNDGFLSENSSPVEIAKDHPWFHLENPYHGGHVAFLQNKKETYAEERALEFIERQLKNAHSHSKQSL